MSKSLTKVLACKVDENLARAVRHAARHAGTSTSQFLRRLAAAAVVTENAE
jgi:hypothetical protein